jgi:hypothetical protein
LGKQQQVLHFVQDDKAFTGLQVPFGFAQDDKPKEFSIFDFQLPIEGGTAVVVPLIRKERE